MQTFVVKHYAFIILAVAYFGLVRSLRYKRANKIASAFTNGRRQLSSMTTQEAFDILTQLQSLEFPYAINKARSIALLKAGGIPSMSKLFAVTGQNNTRNAGKRAVDTEILLRESQTQPPDTERYMNAVARMNYLHARYRKAGKILDEDLLHTLGDGALEIVHVIDSEEWRKLTDVEKCAVGIFHRNLGEDMEIPFTPLKSCETGWRDGLHFVAELIEWTREYEKQVAKPTTTGDHIEAPGPFVSALLLIIRNLRKLFLRHFSLPRPEFLAYSSVSSTPNAEGLYNFSHAGFQPWYIQPSFWTIWSPGSVLLRALGARKPGSNGDRYKPKGYDLKTIGPAPQEGKGFKEMEATVEFMKSRGVGECPFAAVKQRKEFAAKE
ncbi:hypothetical protein DL767_011441 [Monosporascus sp. MG133]|nr:hypothetical protein DL767_011441 [Monosporascus sp. MG133]